MKTNKEIAPVNEASSLTNFAAKRFEAIGTVKGVTKQTFKSEVLTNYAYELRVAAATTGAKSNEVAAILYTIDNEGVYKEDGFKNLADFVRQTGIYSGEDASGIYKLVKAGALLMSSDAKVADWAMTCPTTALSIIGTLDEQDVAKAIDEGKLKHCTSVKEAKDFAKQVKGDKGGVKVVKCYDYSLTWYNVKGMNTIVRENIPGVDALPEAGSYNFTKVAIPEGMSAELTAAYVGTPKEANNAEHGVFMVYAKAHKAKEDKAKKNKALDLSSLDLSTMSPEQLTQLAALVKAATDKA